METWFQQHFVHGDCSGTGMTIAGWLNSLAANNTILEVIPCPIGPGHGTIVLARCIPTENTPVQPELFAVDTEYFVR